MKGKGFLLLSIVVILLGVNIGDSPANGPKPKAKLPSLGPAEPRTAMPSGPVQPELVSLNFSGADLVEVIHVLAQYLKLNYTIDPGVRGTVTLYSAQPLRQQDLLPVFHQVLRMNDAVAVKSGEFYHIAPINAGKGLVRPPRQLGERGYILQVVPVRFFSASEIKRLLEPFITPGGDILEYPRGNFLIILDLASNIQRLLEIKDLIDVNVFAGVRMELYQPKVASAEELAEEMGRIMQAYAASTAQSENFVAQFIPVPRINRLLVISHSEAAWTYAMRWLENIDTYAEGPGRRIFVYPVENGKAVDLADILNQVLGQGPTRPRVPRKTLKDIHERVPGGQLQPTPGLPSAGQSGGSTGQSPSLYAVAPAQPPRPPTRPRPEARAAPPTAPPARPEDQVRIVPDPATNSLIIFGTGQEFQNIRNILTKIDIVPRQVLMDVMIAEVSLEDELEFGVEYQILRDDVEIFGRDFNQHVSLLSGLPAASPPGWSAIIGTGNSIRAFINARREDSRIKVLSSPTILATDGQPARIQVGSEQPIATGTVTSPVSTGVTSSTTIQYRNTGSILTIIPQVNAQGLVHLQVKTEVSDLGASVTVGQDSFPSFTTRDVETTAVVQDGETLAIGGIITDRVERRKLGIPFLMDIPVFGRFFGTTKDDIDRVELIILITPHVIRSKEEARTVTEEFKDILSNVVREYRWEIDNLQRQKRRGQEQQPQPQNAPTVEPQSSIVPQQQEPQKSARKATIVVPSDQKAYESLSSSLASFTPAKEPPVPGREVKAPTESSQQSHVVVLGNKGIENGPVLAKGLVQSDEGTAPTATAC